MPAADESHSATPSPKPPDRELECPGEGGAWSAESYLPAGREDTPEEAVAWYVARLENFAYPAEEFTRVEESEWVVIFALEEGDTTTFVLETRMLSTGKWGVGAVERCAR